MRTSWLIAEKNRARASAENGTPSAAAALGCATSAKQKRKVASPAVKGNFLNVNTRDCPSEHFSLRSTLNGTPFSTTDESSLSSMAAASAGKKSSVRLPTSSVAPPRRRRRAKASLAYTITPSESFTKTAVCSMSSMIFPFL